MSTSTALVQLSMAAAAAQQQETPPQDSTPDRGREHRSEHRPGGVAGGANTLRSFSSFDSDVFEIDGPIHANAMNGACIEIGAGRDTSVRPVRTAHCAHGRCIGALMHTCALCTLSRNRSRGPARH